MWSWNSDNDVNHLVEDNGSCLTCGRLHDKDVSWPEVLGRITGIMQGVKVKAEVALRHPLANEDNTADIYREALTRILAEAQRADALWAQYINRELPEHAVTPYPEREDYDGEAAYLDDVERWETTNETPSSE
jgi:hypothetical protein